jgi:hypothetical protein
MPYSCRTSDGRRRRCVAELNESELTELSRLMDLVSEFYTSVYGRAAATFYEQRRAGGGLDVDSDGRFYHHAHICCIPKGIRRQIGKAETGGGEVVGRDRRVLARVNSDHLLCGKEQGVKARVRELPAERGDGAADATEGVVEFVGPLADKREEELRVGSSFQLPGIGRRQQHP